MPKAVTKRSPPKFITKVFQMPDELEKRQAFNAGLETLMEANGVECTGGSLTDEISKLEEMAKHVDDSIVDEIEQRFERESMPIVPQVSEH